MSDASSRAGALMQAGMIVVTFSSSVNATMASSTFTQRLLVALMICTLIADLSTLTAARPQDSDAASVAAAIRYLQELETKHAQHARPR
uniref:Uncharacterized protein n=1 Tax=Anopheles dirus TaxID=7168 RepID=A0A182NE17_9DIPT